LKHAVEVGAFSAGDAATIAGLARSSGNARSTHAEGLLRADVLERVAEKPVTYGVTERGLVTYRTLGRALREPAPRRKRRRVVLRPGDRVSLEAPSDRGTGVFELARRS
jgi:hypothetical protein